MSSSYASVLLYREGWTISGTPLDLDDRQILAIAAVERHILEAEHDGYVYTGVNGIAFCRLVALFVSIHSWLLN